MKVNVAILGLSVCLQAVGNSNEAVNNIGAVAVSKVVRFEHMLEKIAADRSIITELIAANDIRALRKYLLAVRDELERLRECMNTAMLTGEWKSSELGPERFSILDRVETLNILNTIGLSFTSSYYANPLGTVSNSVSDSVNRFFIQLEHLQGMVSALEAKVNLRHLKDQVEKPGLLSVNC